MLDFSTVKNGYNKIEVEKKISDLNEQIQQKNQQIKDLSQKLAGYESLKQDMQQKSEDISIALTAAVEKAKQIEKSSKSVYKLKLQQLEILYARWERFLNELIQKHPDIEEVENVRLVMQDFKKHLKSTLKEDFKQTTFVSSYHSDSDPIRALLSKMTSYKGRSDKHKKAFVNRKSLSADLQVGQTDLDRLSEKAPITKVGTGEVRSEEESLLDKFLAEDIKDNSVYANKFTAKILSTPEPNESGFDLKEAVNPKDDLDVIMRAFDFYQAD